MSLRNFGIAPRAALGFGLVAFFLLCIGVFSLTQMARMDSASDDINNNWMPSVTTLKEMNQSILRQRIFTLRALMHTDAASLSKTTDTILQLRTEVAQQFEDYKRYMTGAEEQGLFDRLASAYGVYLNDQKQVLSLVDQGRSDEARDYLNGPMAANADALMKTLIALGEFNTKGIAAAAEMSAETYHSARIAVITAIIVAALVTALLAWLLIRSIVQPLSEAVRAAEVIASGDLTQPIAVAGKDEPARLLDSMKKMQANLRDTIQRISDSSTQLASAAEELHVVTEDSSRGLAQQNGEIEQAATAVNQMTAAVDEVARNAVATAEASKESERAGRDGQQQVTRTVQSINQLAEGVTTTAGQVGELADKVRDISKVLDVIRAIAEQTNLLALNAAIEAARAGDAGRGFAVVADEVRALAHRTQQSTQEIEEMIGGIQHGTDRAVQAMQLSNEQARSTLVVAQAAGEALEQIAVAIATISERNMVVASASEEQAQVSREVDRNLINIRDLSMQTSAGANQTSVASQELAQLAVGLRGLVGRFSV
ncbi:methyl-accepting chemotaxis protein [Pseudomonas sp. PS1]|uniref:Methyl-accepting chemotaxis protein n=1 Tax=Stutzerimonas marianensis TaxID=2929513 RepID=A0A9X2ARW7_9GAMM|nr:methyl-accepting chemotaxis protein [Pseudomonas marianensis]MCJ0973025.1 methyl-accepting chemotaxis protein [Pseudomonas marianensis]